MTTVIWLKATPPKGVAWPEGTRHAIVEVPPDLRGAGKDARPPSAYRRQSAVERVALVRGKEVVRHLGDYWCHP
jgi:hypothetical protein